MKKILKLVIPACATVPLDLKPQVSICNYNGRKRQKKMLTAHLISAIMKQMGDNWIKTQGLAR